MTKSKLLDSEDWSKPIIDWWNQLRISGDPGKTTWEVLDELESAVTQAIADGNLRIAHRLTAKAWNLYEDGL